MGSDEHDNFTARSFLLSPIYLARHLSFDIDAHEVARNCDVILKSAKILPTAM